MFNNQGTIVPETQTATNFIQYLVESQGKFPTPEYFAEYARLAIPADEDPFRYQCIVDGYRLAHESPAIESRINFITTHQIDFRELAEELPLHLVDYHLAIAGFLPGVEDTTSGSASKIFTSGAYITSLTHGRLSASPLPMAGLDCLTDSKDQYWALLVEDIGLGHVAVRACTIFGRNENGLYPLRKSSLGNPLQRAHRNRYLLDHARRINQPLEC
ncbi:MAG: hypothetical protein QY318_01215 [Candidatus Dojkabacteria bacterium]|nr:MAG: hypothetical protein QY318_01215 [Candidatus Dojkabacteria bacterium]